MRIPSIAATALLAALAAAVPAGAQTRGAAPADTARPVITKATLRAALDLVGLRYTDAQLDLLLARHGRAGSDFGGRGDRRGDYAAIRRALDAVPVADSVPPALFFEPLPPAVPIPDRPPRFAALPADVQRPANLEDVAFWPIPRLAALLRSKQVTSVELTRMFLARLHRYDPDLHAVVTFTESLALAQAREADRDFAAGRDRGPLQGIPFGAKDLYAVPGYPTTWGARPYEHQVIDRTATAVRKLEEAGGVLVAKLSSGALALDDIWFRGQTLNPWNLKEGSGGSSAGPGAAVSAGLVPYALGTETWGSIVEPSTKTAVAGLRPSFGRVSRAGVMALSWSMDKAGPLCRTAADCALVFDAIRGADPADPTTRDAPFPYVAGASMDGRRIGYIEAELQGDRPNVALARAVVDTLRRLGATLVPIALPAEPVRSLSFLLNAEAAAAFDALTRSHRDTLLVRQPDPNGWANTFRSARFIPAVEYIQANRVRRLVQEDMRRTLKGLDAYVALPYAENLLLTNLTGQPCTVVPDGKLPNGDFTSITFCARMDDEADALEAAAAYQAATSWDELHPPRFGGHAAGR